MKKPLVDVLLARYGAEVEYSTRGKVIRFAEHDVAEKITMRYVALVEEHDSRFSAPTAIEVHQAETLTTLKALVAAAMDSLVEMDDTKDVEAIAYDMKEGVSLRVEARRTHHVSFEPEKE